MIVNMIAEDKTVCVDGYCITGEYDWPESVWAIQWNGTSGEVEYYGDAENVLITDFSAYQSLVDAHASLKAAQLQEIADREAAFDNSITYKTQRREEYPKVGDQLDALFHAGVFPADMATQIQAIKDKYPKP